VKLFLETFNFNLVPGVTGFSWDLSFITWYSSAKKSPPPRAQPKSRFEFVPRDTEESEFLDVVDFGGVANLVETIIY